MEGSSQRGRTTERTKVMQDYTKMMQVTDKQGRSHNLKLNIWDAAGEAAVHNLAHLFLRDAQVGILCYSIDNKNSFE